MPYTRRNKKIGVAEATPIQNIYLIEFTVIHGESENVPVLGEDGPRYYGQVQRGYVRARSKVGDRRAKIRVQKFGALYYKGSFFVFVGNLHFEYAYERYVDVERFGFGLGRLDFYRQRDKVQLIVARNLAHLARKLGLDIKLVFSVELYAVEFERKFFRGYPFKIEFHNFLLVGFNILFTYII